MRTSLWQRFAFRRRVAPVDTLLAGKADAVFFQGSLHLGDVLGEQLHRGIAWEGNREVDDLVDGLALAIRHALIDHHAQIHRDPPLQLTANIFIYEMFVRAVQICFESFFGGGVNLA